MLSKSKMLITELFPDFQKWMDRVMPLDQADEIVAYNFNLYEHEAEFAIQLIGARWFDVDEEDWASDEIFSSGEDLFYLSHEVVDSEWQEGLKAAMYLVRKYLESGKYAALLKDSLGVGVGFVGGDIELVYLPEDDI